MTLEHLRAEVESGAIDTVVLAMTDTCRGMEILRANAPKFHYFRFKDDAEYERYQALLASWG